MIYYKSVRGALFAFAAYCTEDGSEPLKKLISAFFDPEFIRFLLVGVVNTLVGSGVMFALYNLAHCSYWLSTAANYLVGGVLSFFLNKHFTFAAGGRTRDQAWRFALNVAVCYLIAYSAAKPLVYQLLAGTSLRLRDNVAMLAGMLIYTALNYLGQRFFAFAKKGDGSDAKNA
jgi:putative flippase GtrA